MRRTCERIVSALGSPNPGGRGWSKAKPRRATPLRARTKRFSQLASVVAALVAVGASGAVAQAAGPGEPTAQAGNVKLQVGATDLAVIAVYLVGIVLLGCWAGLRKRRTAQGSDYFLAGKSLRWPMIGLALFATNISTIHLVSFAQNGYTSGLVYGNFEWMAAFTLVILSWFFAPFYIRSGVATLPDFMEKRYSRGSRDYLAVLSIFSAIVVHIGFSLYTGSIVIEGIVLRPFVENPHDYHAWTVIAICGATAIYTIVGGLLAVVVTESIQTVVLLAGSICITLLGLYMMGGWDGSWSGLVHVNQMAEGWQKTRQHVHPVNFSMIRSDADPTGISWYAVLLGYPVLGIWYWCTDQTIVQRVLGARDENHARIGPLFAGFIKILPVLIFVVPGIVCLALVTTGEIGRLPLRPDGTPNTEEAYTHLVANVLPLGLRGVVVAALLAALMSTVSGALNSIATLFSYDIYKRFKPEADDRHLIRVGRVATFVAMCVAILWTLGIGGQKSIFQMMVDVFPVVAPPTAVVFLWGVFWRRASATASLCTLIGGSLLGLVLFVLNFNQLNYIGDYEINALFQAFLLFVIESLLLVLLSFIFPHRHTAESETLVWRSPLEALRSTSGTWRGLGDYRVLSVLLVAVMVGLYVWFSGEDTYYPVEGRVTLADGTPVAGARLGFDCDDDRFDFTALTDAEGRYTYTTPDVAGGAPAGTQYRVTIVPAVDLIVRRAEPAAGHESAPTDPAIEEILYRVPAGTPIRAETLSKQVPLDEEWTVTATREVYTFTLPPPSASRGTNPPASPQVVHVARDQRVEILRATDVPRRYRQFDTSPLSCRVEAIPAFSWNRNKYDFQLSAD